MGEDTFQTGGTHDVAMQIQELDEKFTKLAKDLRDIRLALLGSDLQGLGLVKLVENQGLRVDAVEKRLDRAFWFTAGAALGGGLFGGTLSAYLIKAIESGGG